jgi:hypothetical protein
MSKTGTVVLVARHTCGCGQELDLCGGSHCPRCGAWTGRHEHVRPQLPAA